MKHQSFADFHEFSFEAGEIGKTVFRSRIAGPAVILIHELPGMVPECQWRAEWIAERGFTVYMPLLFGEPGENYGMRPLFWPCVRREFHLWGSDRTSPVVTFLTRLARRAHEECGGPGVGAIGMCLTGGFGLAMMVEPAVRAPVLCQPSIPNAGFPVRQLGISREDYRRACDRCGEERIDVLGLRFEEDWICRRQRFDRLREDLKGRFQSHVIGEDGRSTKRGHSTLTLDFYQNEGFAEEEKWEIEEKLIDHLNRFLR